MGYCAHIPEGRTDSEGPMRDDVWIACTYLRWSRELAITSATVYWIDDCESDEVVAEVKEVRADWRASTDEDFAVDLAYLRGLRPSTQEDYIRALSSFQVFM